MNMFTHIYSGMDLVTTLGSNTVQGSKWVSTLSVSPIYTVCSKARQKMMFLLIFILFFVVGGATPVVLRACSHLYVQCLVVLRRLYVIQGIKPHMEGCVPFLLYFIYNHVLLHSYQRRDLNIWKWASCLEWDHHKFSLKFLNYQIYHMNQNHAMIWILIFCFIQWLLWWPLNIIRQCMQNLQVCA